ncbi:cell wall metabolism sensor histidine kinase WalK [Bacillus taeanensis]|uniref:histidine kinase n=1 Tax=Bacillus taeanensis TaxID=273032 RepID=A0A366XRX1_9BACI|nr:cell wall metabolism sensor histidine kinase WalK [Bacillus taeanensis]RBW69120.1 cell wall metabolism sensor histidine kinase WalK [Bacillus taeanensis]
MGKVKFFRSIHVKLALIYVLLILVTVQIISVYFIQQLEAKLRDNFIKSVNERVELLAYNLSEEFESESANKKDNFKVRIADIVRNSQSETIREIQVIDFNGEVIAKNIITGVGGQRTSDPRVKIALLGSSEGEVLRDPNTGHRIYVLAMPIKNNDTVKGAIYIEASMEDIYTQMKDINKILVTGTIIALVITAILGIVLARTITKPMTDMRKHALIMARGDFSRKVKVYGDDEIGQLASAFNDLTKRLQEANAITEGERKKLSSVLSYMTDGVIATDSDGMIILMNDRSEQMLNVSRQNVLGTPLLNLLRLSKDLTWDDLYIGSDSMLLDFSNDEQTYILRANFSLIQNEENEINGLITVLHDVTEQEQIEQERREFVVNVSHELRTPLTTLKSYLEALQDGAWQDPDIAPKFLSVTQNETDRMIRLVNDLLQLSKMDKKEYQLTMVSFDFVEYFHKIIDRFEMSKNENIQFVRQLQDLKVVVYGDKDKLTQVLDNIISNALKYSPEGGTITFRCWLQGKKIRVSVSDEGVGIPKANLSKIFDRFYRVDRARSRQLGGTGLGLAIAKEMIHTHGGDIWAESEWGIGTTIYFTLPYKKVSEVGRR